MCHSMLCGPYVSTYTYLHLPPSSVTSLSSVPPPSPLSFLRTFSPGSLLDGLPNLGPSKLAFIPSKNNNTSSTTTPPRAPQPPPPQHNGNITLTTHLFTKVQQRYSFVLEKQVDRPSSRHPPYQWLFGSRRGPSGRVCGGVGHDALAKMSTLLRHSTPDRNVFRCGVAGRRCGCPERVSITCFTIFSFFHRPGGGQGPGRAGRAFCIPSPPPNRSYE